MKKFSRLLLIALAASPLNAGAATVIVNPTSTNRVLQLVPTTVLLNNEWTTYRDASTNLQRTLQTTTNATFNAALASALGAPGPGESYQINSAILTAGNSDDNYTHTSTVHLVLTSYDSATVTWSTFNNGGVAGTNYASAAAATGTVGANSVSYDLTSTVQGWLANSIVNRGIYAIGSNVNTSNGSFTAYGNVSWTLDAVKIPEPGSAGMVGLAGTLLLIHRRRR